MKYRIHFVCILSLLLCTHAVQAKYFDELKNTKDRQSRFQLAHKLYYKNVLPVDSINAKSAYNELITIAQEENDTKLRAYAEIMMTDYYYDHLMHRHDNIITAHLNQALKIASAGKFPDITADIYHHLGMWYYHDNKYSLAFEYLLKANNVIKQIGYANYPYASKFLYNLGYCYYDFTNYNKSREFLQEALRYSFCTKKNEIEIYNTIGLCFRELMLNDSAIHYFQQAINVAKDIRDSVWIGIATGNIAYVLYREKKYDAALPMLQTDYNISRHHQQWASAMNTLNIFADIYIERGQMDKAIEALSLADTMLIKAANNNVSYQYYLRKAKICSLQSNYHDAYSYLDSAVKYRELVIRRNNASSISQAEQKAEVEQHLTDIELLQAERNKQLIIRNAIIIVILLSLVIAFQFIHKQKLAQKRNAEVLQNAKDQLNYYIDSVREKTQLIEQFKSEIEQLNTLPNAPMQIERDEMIQKLQTSTILTETDWDDFRHLFERVHKDFFIKLRRDYPGLTQAEIRLIALSKLDLSKNEMAEMLGVSLDAIRKTRQRIRKKLDLADERALDNFLVQV